MTVTAPDDRACDGPVQDDRTRYSLVAKLRDPRDAAAWAEFAELYQPLILRIALGRGLQHADAIDLTQDVLARVAASVERFDPGHPGVTFRGWLYRITRNLLVDFLRRRGRSPLVQAEEHVRLAADADPGVAEREEFLRQYQRQLFRVVAGRVRGQVKPATWQAFWRTEIDGVPVGRVAAETGLSPGAVYVARSRVLARLKDAARQQMTETGLEPPE